MSATSIRVAIVLDIPAEQLVEAYGSLDAISADELEWSLAARLEEFYPGQDGYATPSSVTAVIVDSDSHSPLPSLTRDLLNSVYVVGGEGLAHFDV